MKAKSIVALLFFCAALAVLQTACAHKYPAPITGGLLPVYTDTPVATSTYTVVMTATPANTAINTQANTPVNTATSAMTNTPVYTAVSTVTQTQAGMATFTRTPPLGTATRTATPTFTATPGTGTGIRIYGYWYHDASYSPCTCTLYVYGMAATLQPLGLTAYTPLPSGPGELGMYEFLNVPPGSYTVNGSGESYVINAYTPGNYLVPSFCDDIYPCTTPTATPTP
jgi:hypothetical protein